MVFIAEMNDLLGLVQTHISEAECDTHLAEAGSGSAWGCESLASAILLDKMATPVYLLIL